MFPEASLILIILRKSKAQIPAASPPVLTHPHPPTTKSSPDTLFWCPDLGQQNLRGEKSFAPYSGFIELFSHLCSLA